ncbi:MAG: methyltransferase domain-containing protein, partial [Pseudomonadota bacterium]
VHDPTLESVVELIPIEAWLSAARWNTTSREFDDGEMLLLVMLVAAVSTRSVAAHTAAATSATSVPKFESVREADAQTAPFEVASFDAAFSRFGVMFFADPPAAFANIRRALKPGGRLAFVCWRPAGENPVMSLPMAAAMAHLPAPPVPPPAADPHAPGPFAFADPERVRGILAAAGFGDVEITPHDQKIGSGDLDQTLTVALKVGPLGAMLRENPGHRDAVIAAVREALAPHARPEGVRLDSATWIVTARRP